MMEQAICKFLDRNPFHRPDSTGLNRVGYKTRRDTMIYQRRHNFVEVSLARLCPTKMEAYEITGSESELAAIETFFTRNVLNTFLMNRGLYAVAQGPRDLFATPIKLPILTPLTNSEWTQRWEMLPSVLQKFDIIQVFDGTSLISRLITLFDRGSWSHVGTYSGDGMILEAITSGVTERSINVYRRPGVRMGVYRFTQASTESCNKAILNGRLSVGTPYGWRMAFEKAWQVLFHTRRENKRFIPSPNDLIVRTEGIELIFLL